MNFARPVAATLGFGCLLVAFAGRGTVGIPDYLEYSVGTADPAGRIGLAALGLALFGAIAGHWWWQRRRQRRQPSAAGQPAAPRPRTPIVSVPPDTLTVHYHRPDGRYDDWKLYYFGDGLAAADQVAWPGRRWDGVDAFGAVWHIPIADLALPLGLEVHKGKVKDPYGPIIVEPSRGGSWYLAGGRPGAHPTASAALNAPLDQRELVLHYHRPAGDYDGWTLWCYDGPADPPVSFERSVPPEPYRDDFGIVFRVPLAPGAPGMKFILHHEDVKDHPPNGGEVRVDEDGLEVWVRQGELGSLRPAPL